MSKTVLFFFMLPFFAGSQDIYLTYLCSCYLYLFKKKRNRAENILNQMISILAEHTFDCISLHFANWQRSKFKEEGSNTVM